MVLYGLRAQREGKNGPQQFRLLKNSYSSAGIFLRAARGTEVNTQKELREKHRSYSVVVLKNTKGWWCSKTPVDWWRSHSQKIFRTAAQIASLPK